MLTMMLKMLLMLKMCLISRSALSVLFDSLCVCSCFTLLFHYWMYRLCWLKESASAERSNSMVGDRGRLRCWAGHDALQALL